MQALARWQHPVASNEARGVLYREMRPALVCRTHMAIDIVSDLPAFFVVISFVVAHNRS
jgi:hypothetical protein